MLIFALTISLINPSPSISPLQVHHLQLLVDHRPVDRQVAHLVSFGKILSFQYVTYLLLNFIIRRTSQRCTTKRPTIRYRFKLDHNILVLWKLLIYFLFEFPITLHPNSSFIQAHPEPPPEVHPAEQVLLHEALHPEARLQQLRVQALPWVRTKW